MVSTGGFRIVNSDKVVLEQFRRWHTLLASVSEQVGAGEYVLPELGFKYRLHETEHTVPDCYLTWGVDANGRTVQINPAAVAGDANVLSAIAENLDQPGCIALLRQGRLQINGSNTQYIFEGDFRFAAKALPVRTIGGFGAKGREWHLVCDISDNASDVARQTANFVKLCAQVRAKYGG